MRKKELLYGSSLVLVLLFVGVVDGFSQVQAVQSRIPQQVVVNGQSVTGEYVVGAGGGFQNFSCPNPQQYTTADGSSQGWACYEQSSGTWLLNALPPVQAQVQQPTVVYPQQQPPVIYSQQPTVIYSQPAPTIIYTAPVFYPARPVVVAPAYPSSVVLETAAINATGRIVSAAIIGSRTPRVYYVPAHGHRVRGWRR